MNPTRQDDMSMDQEEKRQLTEVVKLVKEMHKVVVGDPLDRNAPPGLMSQIEDHHTTLYGDKERDIEGIVPQHNTMWRDRTKVFAVVSAGVAACGCITWLINVLRGH